MRDRTPAEKSYIGDFEIERVCFFHESFNPPPVLEELLRGNLVRHEESTWKKIGAKNRGNVSGQEICATHG